MIIRSSFEDYYDGQQAYGVDDHVVYERKLRQSVLNPDLIDHPEFVSLLRRADDDWIPGIGLLGICGIGFPVETGLNAYRPQEPRSPGWLPSGDMVDASDFSEVLQGYKIGDAAFLDLGTPTFLTLPKVYDDDWITFSGFQLKAFGIQKVFAPFDAFVMIRNYIVNVLSKPDDAPTTVGDDKTIARQKGFDDQSFRQAAPGNKKVNRASNRLKKKSGQ